MVWAVKAVQTEEVDEEQEWSKRMFGSCELGDARRTKRLVDVAARLSRQAGQSLAKCCEDDEAALQGSYRLMRNDAVQAQAIRESALNDVAQRAQQRELLLAIEDTTTLTYTHAAAAQLGSTGSRPNAKQRGYLVHSVLLLDARSQHTLGLIEQRHWCRDEAEYGKKHQRRQRRYVDKESYKWQHASEQMAQRLDQAMRYTISVCDRESDVYEYLQYKQQHEQRYVVRAQVDRRVLQAEQPRLFAALASQAHALCEYEVPIEQRAGRRARQAKVSVRSLTVSLQAPRHRPKAGGPLQLNAVLIEEEQPPADQEALHWILLTSEPVSSSEQALQVVRYYELRWRIEEYHKAWKSGVGVERQRLQSKENLERMLVLTAFVAVRLLQLREQLGAAAAQESSCETALSRDEWQVLWWAAQGRQRQPLPSEAPSMHWAYLAVAKLGGFTDTKRTGRAGWDTLWRGWLRLQERVRGFVMAKEMTEKM